MCDSPTKERGEPRCAKFNLSVWLTTFFIIFLLSQIIVMLYKPNIAERRTVGEVADNLESVKDVTMFPPSVGVFIYLDPVAQLVGTLPVAAVFTDDS